MSRSTDVQRQKECDLFRQNAAEEYRTAVEGQISRAGEIVTRSTVPDARRTCIVDLLHRLADTPGVRRVLIVTDGEETCLPAFQGRILPPDRPTIVAVAIISKQDSKLSPHEYYPR